MMDGDHAGAEWKRFERLVTVLDSQTLPAANTKPYLAIVKRYESAINQLGLSSAKAQNLLEPITSWRRFSETRDEQRLYLLHHYNNNPLNGPLNGGTSAAAAVTIAGESVIGLLKVGRRQIYTLDQQSGQQKPTKALCVLDFFIADKYQRAGLGVRLFDYMLDCERVKPGHLAYDRPSFRLISFLSKHYRLDAPQHFYRFVVFPEFGNQHQQRPVCGNKPNYRKGLVLE